jgi:hypothetical protein
MRKPGGIERSDGPRRGRRVLAGAALATIIVSCVAWAATGSTIPDIRLASSLASPRPQPAAARPTPLQRREVESAQGYPYYPYDGSWTFVRIQTRGFGGGGRGGWSHDYPAAEINFSRILSEITNVPVRLLPAGGNVLTFEDPRLGQFPIAYVSEPGDWQTSPAEAEALRKYLLRGGFVIFDDFFEWEMENLMLQMKRALPELEFLPLDGTEPLWTTFFAVDPLTMNLQGPRKSGIPRFWGLYQNNDKQGRMLAVANAGADIGDFWEWSAEGLYPVDPSNVAFMAGVNYIIYALTR